MGAKKPSVRTLPSGEQVTHYPDGTQELIPGPSAVGSYLDDAEEAMQAANDQLAEKRLEAVSDKQASLDAGNPVPTDKRVV